MQNAARRKLEFGQYNPNLKMSRVEYAMDLFSIAMELDQNRDEAVIVKQLTQQYEREIRCALRRQNSQTNSLLFTTSTRIR